MVSKKQDERCILNLIYSDADYAEIVESEQPDFRIKHKEMNSYFGVEITEYYYSEPYARLRKISGYLGEIIGQGNYRHKLDKEVLKPTEITITSAEGKVKGTTRVIMQEVPQLTDYANSIADIIKTKDAKSGKYDQSLTHTNLIIFDAERNVQLVSLRDFCTYFFTDEIKQILYTTCFREIFLITVLDENRQVYIPLKMLLLLADFHMFGTLLSEYPWETLDSSEDQSSENDTDESILMKLFATYMRSKTENVYFREDAEQVEVVFGNSSMGIKAAQKVIHDYNDYPPKDFQSVNENTRTAFFRSAEFREKAKEILKNFSFYAEIAFDVKEAKRFQ